MKKQILITGDDATARLLNLIRRYREIRDFSASAWFEVREIRGFFLYKNRKWRDVEGLSNVVNAILEGGVENIQELMVFDYYRKVRGDEENVSRLTLYCPSHEFIRKFCDLFVTT